MQTTFLTIGLEPQEGQRVHLLQQAPNVLISNLRKTQQVQIMNLLGFLHSYQIYKKQFHITCVKYLFFKNDLKKIYK